MFDLNVPRYSHLFMLFTIVIIIAIHTYDTIDAITQHNPPFTNIEDGSIAQRAVMIYPTKTGGDEWFMDANLQNDKRFDANANLTKNQDGSWSVNSSGQTTLNIWSNDSGDFRQKGGMNTYNQNIIESRGYWYKPSDWKNVEMTGYFKLSDYVEDEYSTYSRSIWHNRTHNGCGGSDYKLKLHFDGSVTFDKEEWHVHYSEQPKLAWMPEHKIIDGLGNLTNKWIGLKNVVYNIEQNGTTYPKLEMWIDQNNSNIWEKVSKYYDLGRTADAPLMFLDCDGWDNSNEHGYDDISFTFDSSNNQDNCKASSADEINRNLANRYTIRGWSHDSEKAENIFSDEYMLHRFIEVVEGQDEYNNKNIDSSRVSAIPIIIWHNIANNVKDDPYTTTSVSLFESEIKYLSDNGFTVLTMSNLEYDEGNSVLKIKGSVNQG
jgi:hypothetical protein